MMMRVVCVYIVERGDVAEAHSDLWTTFLLRAAPKNKLNAPSYFGPATIPKRFNADFI